MADAHGTDHPPPVAAEAEEEAVAEEEAGALEEEEYESEAEDAPLPAMRRREVDSDEEDGGGTGDREAPLPASAAAAGVVSEGDLDDQGAPEEYGEEEGGVESVVPCGWGSESEDGGACGEAAELDGGERVEGDEEVGGEEVKESEPYSVPTSGAFYMHDDRCQETRPRGGGGRRRPLFGGKKSWDVKAEHAWVHDRFEEFDLQDAHYEQGRRSRGGGPRGRGGRGRKGGAARGSFTGGRAGGGGYYENGTSQQNALRVTCGRGPRRYESHNKNVRNGAPATQKSTGRTQEPTSNAVPRRGGYVEKINEQPDAAAPKKHVFASSLSIASPPFYPSGSGSTKDAMNQRIDRQNSSNGPPLKIDDKMASQSDSQIQGKGSDSGGRNAPYLDHRSGNSMVFSGYAVTSSVNSGQTIDARTFQRRGQNVGAVPDNQSTSPLQFPRASPQSQVQAAVFNQLPIQVPAQSLLRAPAPQTGQRSSGNQASPPPSTQPSMRPMGDGGSNISSGSANSKAMVDGSGKGVNQVAERGSSSFIYNGAQIVGASGQAMGLPHADQNFPGTPALLPVMQFGPQRPGGIGVPAVGMALPGYVAPQQLGIGTSEMAWLPLLAGATSAFGASYCPPYIALDASMFNRSSGSASSVSSREVNASKESQPLAKQDLANEELDQRQSKPRRYSEMNFGQ